MNRTVILGFIGAFIVVAALLLNHFLTVDPNEELASQPGSEAGATAESSSEPNIATQSDTDGASGSATEAGNGVDAQASAAGVDPSTEGAAADDAGPHTGDQASVDGGDAASGGLDADASLIPPSFDVVRISREGDTVIAGRAAPGAEVIVLDGEEEIGRISADSRGEWVYLPDSPLVPGSHNLSLLVRTPDNVDIPSTDSVVLVVPEKGKDVAGATSDEPGEALAVLVPKNPGKLGTKVLQKPSGDGVAAETGDLVVDSVDYDDKGKVSIGGRGKPGTAVQAYLDDKVVGTVEVQPDGQWQVTPDDDVQEGVYTLRVDEVESGKVTARLELPFSKARPILDFEGDNFIIVQPGNSLWRIARRTLGNGYSYSVIYEANRDQIRDPDLIYPGQIFEVPAN